MKKLLLFTAGIGLVAVIGTVIAGALLSEGTVVKDPYATALRWDASHHDRIQSGWKVAFASKSIKSPASEMILSVLDRTGKTVTDAAVELHLTLPATDRHDSWYRMERSAAGRYKAMVRVPVRGRWIVRINVDKEDKSINFDETITVE